MALIYVNLLYAGRRTWAKVPDSLKEDVKYLIKADVVKGSITPERYSDITGESYTA